MKCSLSLLWVLSLLLTCSTTFSQATYILNGEIIDAKTKKPLPYASVGIAGLHLGTITNGKGKFTLYVPDSLNQDTLQVNYLGYHPFSTPVSKIANKSVKIKLKPTSTEIGEVIVRPLNPLEVIERVRQNYDDNYPSHPFITKGFYLQEIIENEQYVDFIEAYIDIYDPGFSDTNTCQARIIQGRTKENLTNIQFLKRFAEQKQAKAEKKAERKGDTLESDRDPGVYIDFGGPLSIASNDNIRNLQNFLDEKSLKKYTFNFEKNTFFAGRELIVIRAKSKKAIDGMLIDAQLYVDKESFALVIIKTDLTIKIPAYLKPFLKIYRIKLYELNINQQIEYRLVDNHWYPNKNLSFAYFDAQKKYKGKYLERSKINVKKAFTSTDIEYRNIMPFDSTMTITKEPLHDQLGDYEPSFWENRNKIEYTLTEQAP